MLGSYFTTAFRGLRRNRSYTFINLIGLSTGLAVCLVVGIFVRHELSFDRFLPNSDRVYQALSARRGLDQAMRDQFPQIRALTSVGAYGAERIFEPEGSAERYYRVEDVFYTYPSFLDVFPYRLTSGSPETALDQKDSVLLTELLARRIFGDENVLGKAIVLDGYRTLTVTGVVEDPPTNAHFRFSALLSSGPPHANGGAVQWRAYGGGKIYIELVPGASLESLQTAVTAFVDEQTPDYDTAISIRPVTDIHLYSGGDDVIVQQSDIRYLYLFSGVGFLVLLIACANYINMATARAAMRIREISIRKVVGATRRQIMVQLLGESILTTMIALPLAIVFADMALPFINGVSGQLLGLNVITDALGIAILMGTTLLVGLLSGIIPAIFLIHSGPRAMLGFGMVRPGGKRLRKALIMGQFAATMFLIMTTAVMELQRRFIQNQNLGFDTEHVITSYSGTDHYPEFKQALRFEPGVQAVSFGPVLGVGSAYMVTSFPDPETGVPTTVTAFDVDYDYAVAMGLEMRSGRFFSPEVPADSNHTLVLNPSAARILGLENGQAGETVDFIGGTFRVVGVTGEFHNSSLHSEVQPIVFRLNRDAIGTMIVRLAPGNLSGRLEAVRATWNSVVPDQPFIYHFADEQIEAQYASEKRLASLFGILSAIAIVVACLGLLGLAAFMTSRRTKEVGIRKVLGATVTNIVLLLSTEFVRLVALAFVFVLPVVVLVARKWLDNFAYRIELPWGMFLAVGLGAVFLTLLVVGFQALRTASSDPVQSLRYE